MIDQARAFKFIIDDIEKKMSHVNWMDTASKSAAYSLKNYFDQEVFEYIGGNVDPSMVLGADAATSTGDMGQTTEAVALGHDGTSEIDPLNLLSRMARLLDDNDVPEEDRWVVASPEFYELLADTNSKLLNVDYNAGEGSLRNGLVSSGKLRGFSMYKSNNLPAATNTGVGLVLAGQKSAVASGNTILETEVLRHQESFGDLVRGLHVFGRKVLRPEALAAAYWTNGVVT